MRVSRFYQRCIPPVFSFSSSLNCGCQIAVGTAGPQLRAPDVSRHCPASTRALDLCRTAGLQLREPDLWQWARGTSIASAKCQIECQKRCQIECLIECQREWQNRSQIECQIECQSICQIECHGGDHSKISFFKMSPVTIHLARFIQTHFWRQYRRNVVSKYQMICVTHGNMLEWKFTKDI